jgi:hypothetical protein
MFQSLVPPVTQRPASLSYRSCPGSQSDQQTQKSPGPQPRSQRRTFVVIYSLFCNLQ